MKRFFTGVVLAGGGADAPRNWLPQITPPFGPSPSLGLDFITNSLIPYVINMALFFTVVLSLIFLLIGGIKWTTSSGDKEALTKAKGTVTYALVGLALGLTSFIILSLIQQFFGMCLGLPFCHDLNLPTRPSGQMGGLF